MTLNAYAPCPCGSGKKLKFCCADLMGEMEKIQKMLAGDQRAGCLAHVKSLTAKHPERPSLLALQAMLQIEQDQYDDARQTLDTLLGADPGNPVAYAELAILTARTNGGREAVGPLGKAIAAIGDEIPLRVYEAIGAVGQALLAQGEIFAAQAHLALQAGIGNTDDDRAATLLVRLKSEPQVPLMLKDDPQLAVAPDGVAWKAKFDAAFHDAARGAWHKAEHEFKALVEPSGDAPEVWKNIALCRGWTADTEGCVAALHKYALLDVSLDDAVEAEALAQMLDPSTRGGDVDIVGLTYSVQDVDALETQLVGNPCVSQLRFSPEDVASENGPPPRSMFSLLDRPVPSSVAELTIDEVPNIVGRASLFGRETDREPRIEVVTHRNSEMEAAQSMIREIGGELLGDAVDEEVLAQTSETAQALGWSWHWPEEAPRDVREKLTEEKRRQVIFERWPSLSLPVLDGRTPNEAAKDSAGRIKALAAILLLELATAADYGDLDYNQLRRQLDLPTADPIDPRTQPNRFIPLARLARVMADKLPDDELIGNYRRALMHRDRDAVIHLGTEIVGRENLDKVVDKAEVYGHLADAHGDPDKALPYIERARTIAEEAGKSSAPWDLAELALHIDRGDSEAARGVYLHIRDNHSKEPGVAQSLMEILVAAGIVTPDGMPVQHPADAESELMLPTQQGSQAGEIWTPDSERGESKESKLWVPGAD